MKTFLHAKQNKFEWIHLQVDNRMLTRYKPERQYTGPMLWYHPALLILENYTDMIVFFYLNQVIHDVNSYNSYAIVTGDAQGKPKYQNLLNTYLSALSVEKSIPHEEVYILSHPHYPFKSTVDATADKTVHTFHADVKLEDVSGENNNLTFPDGSAPLNLYEDIMKHMTNFTA